VFEVKLPRRTWGWRAAGGSTFILVSFAASPEPDPLVMGVTVLDDLLARGLVAQVSDAEGLSAHLAGGSRTLYAGFDPTAESLHIGSLVPLLTLRRFQLHGHRPILLLGGATGLIGDPSFRVDERSLNEASVVAGWVARIHDQVQRFLDFEGNNGAIIVNNIDWIARLDVITFLREYGKHFSVNTMIQRESVRSRLERDGAGISYTEFSYMLLQAIDYVKLAEIYGCSLQIGGSDQWGNIVSGMDLVRRKLGRESFALTLPLITKSDGSKFGKTAGGTVWLDAAKTSPYAFYQFWMNVADEDAARYLRLFTFLDLATIEETVAAHALAPERREAQRRLAQELTRLVHGDEAVRSAERIARNLFDGELSDVREADLEQLALDGMDTTALPAEGAGLLEGLVRSGLAQSNAAARRLVEGGGVRVNGVVEHDPERRLDWRDALFGRYFLVRRGKKHWHLLRRS
jgi:tyrosyl-tRNA synthetase